MSAPILFPPLFRAFDTAGNPLAGGQLFTYAAGTTTPLATYSDDAGTVQNANPVILDTTGSAVVRLGTGAYKFVLKDSGGSTQYTVDHYVGSGDNPTFVTLTVTGSTTLGSVSASAGIFTGTVIAGAIQAPGVWVTAIKTADLPKANTQTFANDPDLSLTVLVGRYEVEALLQFGCTTTTTQGFKTRLLGTLTASGTGGPLGYANGAAITSPILNAINNTLYGGQADITGTTDWLYFKGQINVTVAGTLVVQWAQNSATNQTNNTTLFAGSYLKAMKLS